MEEICQASNTAKYFCLKQQWWWHQWNLNQTIHFFASVFNLIGSKWNLVAVTTMKKVSVAWPLLSFIGSQFSHILVFLFETTVVMVPVKPQQQQWQQWMKHSGSNNNEKSKCYMTSLEFYWITILTHWITILTHFGINSHTFWYSCLKQQWWWCQWNLNKTINILHLCSIQFEHVQTQRTINFLHLCSIWTGPNGIWQWWQI